MAIRTATSNVFGVRNANAKRFTGGTISGVNQPRQLVHAIVAHMVDNGWEILSSADHPTDTNFAMRGLPLDPVCNNAPVLRISSNATSTTLGITIYGSNYDGGPSLTQPSGSQLQIYTGPFLYWCRANGYAIAIGTMQGTSTSIVYAGFVRRMLPYNRSGLTALDDHHYEGSITLKVKSNMVGRLQEGQAIAVIRAGGDGQGDAYQTVRIRKVTPTHIHLWNPIDKSLPDGSSVGSDPYPMVLSPAESGIPLSSWRSNFYLDGYPYDSTPELDLYESYWSWGRTKEPGAVFYPNVYGLYSEAHQNAGFRGVPYHFIMTDGRYTLNTGDIVVNGSDEYYVARGDDFSSVLVKMD